LQEASSRAGAGRRKERETKEGKKVKPKENVKEATQTRLHWPQTSDV
jgi:hypothetical protein